MGEAKKKKTYRIDDTYHVLAHAGTDGAAVEEDGIGIVDFDVKYWIL